MHMTIIRVVSPEISRGIFRKNSVNYFSGIFPWKNILAPNFIKKSQEMSNFRTFTFPEKKREVRFRLGSLGATLSQPACVAMT